MRKNWRVAALLAALQLCSSLAVAKPQSQAIPMAGIFRFGARFPVRTAWSNVSSIRSPLVVCRISRLKVFDAVYASVRGEPFAKR